jgi:23S rRNA U2552 (ribose-2'-O)-methylase RlmE/FtsJ
MASFNITYTNINNNKNLFYQLNKNIIDNKKLFYDINEIKKEIDYVPYYKWKIIRSIVTKYEMIGNNSLHNIRNLHEINCISRAYFKMFEILHKYEKELNIKREEPMRISGLAEAPGGFIQCMINYRNNEKDDITGISLKDSKDNKIDWTLKNDVKIIYGDESKGHDGNLYNPEIINYYCDYYKDNKADLVTSDGGFLLNKNQENFKGQYHMNLFISEIYIALKILKEKGSFVIKVYELCFKSMVDILVILNMVFKKVDLVKPKTSREMNNEKYIVCLDYKENIDINKKLFEIINNMWENKNKLIINNILNLNKEQWNIVRKYKNFCIGKLNHQFYKLQEGISYKHCHIKELNYILRGMEHEKYNNALSWINENKIFK